MITDNRNIDLVVVVPVARPDWHLAVKLLRFMSWLHDEPSWETIVLCSPALSDAERLWLKEAGAGINAQIEIASSVQECGYFGGANSMMLAALTMMEAKFPGHAMLWVEADCVPMRATWVEELQDEYRNCGMPFMADVVRSALTYLTGNGVYHPDWRQHAPSLADIVAIDPAWGWDSKCAGETFPKAHLTRQIQQIWRPPLPITREWATDNIRPECALFHQVKDGSLIDLLSPEPIPLDAPLCESTYEKEKHNHGMEHARPKGSAAIPAPMKPKMAILIVTFARDIEFLRYCIRGLEKYATGFQEIVLLVPTHEKGKYDWAASTARIEYFDEVPGKGMLSHEAEIFRADEWCRDATHILHLDADCMPWDPITPEHYLIDGRALCVREPYSKITNPNRHLWKNAVDNAVGIDPTHDPMVRHPNVHVREVYAKTRAMIEKRTNREWREFVFKGPNTFPQQVAEFPTLAAVAARHFAERYHFEDYDKDADARECTPNVHLHQYVYRRGRDRIVECWSHGTVAPYRDLLESCLAGTAPAFVVK